MTAVSAAVNLLWIAPGRVGGSEEYLVRQLLGLAAWERDLPETDRTAVTLFATKPFAEAHPELVAHFDVVTSPARRDWRGARIAAEHTWLATRTGHADVIHHGGGTVPLVGPGPRLVTIHDLQFRRFPHYFSRGRRAYLGAMLPIALRRAALIATPTEFVRSTVMDEYGVPADRVVVVPHGVPSRADPDRAVVDDARRAVGVGERPFVVYPAITHPHKAHRVLVDMIDHLHARGDDDLALLLVGGEGSAETDLRRAIGASRHADRIVRAGRVDDATRDALVADAEALVFPSEFEGFGAPLIEAMTLGTPVVASAAAAVREVVGDAAIVVSEGSGAAWADAVLRARSDRDDLVRRGAERREAFSIEASGRALTAAYRAAAEGGSS